MNAVRLFPFVFISVPNIYDLRTYLITFFFTPADTLGDTSQGNLNLEIHTVCKKEKEKEKEKKKKRKLAED